jgi:hypothetical protein
LSGVRAIRNLLAQNQGVLAVVPAPRIFAGDAPVNCQLPAISVKQISGIPAMLPAQMAEPLMWSERVQVTVLVKSAEATPAGSGYPGLKSLLALVLSACGHFRGTAGGVNVDSVLPDLQGPDLSDFIPGVLTQSQDFFVKYV